MSYNNSRPYMTTQEEREIANEYKNGVPMKQILAQHNLKTPKSVTDKLKKYYPDNYKEIMEQVKERRKGYSLDLSIIDSNFKAYLVGLLITDGCVNEEQHTIEFDSTDEDCVRFISESTSKEYKTYKPYSKGTLPIHRIVFHSKENVEYLKRYGIVQAKSLIIQPPKLYEEEEKYLPYLFRGIIDGNGSVVQTSYGAPWFRLVSASKAEIDWYKDVFENKFFMYDMCIDVTEKEGHNTLYNICTADPCNIAKLKAIVYDRPYGMARKYNKLREMLRDYNKDNSIAS